MDFKNMLKEEKIMAGFDFSNFNVGSSNQTPINFGIDLGEYAAIKNGSYSKLTKAYYAKQEQQIEQAEEKTDSKQTLSRIKGNADSLKQAADKLSSRSLWDKKDIKVKDEETGETITKKDYDRAAINTAIKSFVDEYNNMIDAAGNSETKNVLRTTMRMIGDTETASKLLDEVGIKIGADNKLSIDEEKLKDASIGTLKTLFEGSGSYADHISQKAGVIGRSAKDATDTYTSSGTYTNGLSGGSSAIGTTNNKATYQISDDMKEAILEQVKLDFYMYGGKTDGLSDSSTYTRKLDKYLDSLDSDKRSDAKDSIAKFRDELSDLVSKAIKAEDSEWKTGATVDTSILNKVFMKEEDLLKQAAANAYGNSFSQFV